MTDNEIETLRKEYMESGPSLAEFAGHIALRGWVCVEWSPQWLESGKWGDKNYSILISNERDAIITGMGVTLRAAFNDCITQLRERAESTEKSKIV